MLRLLLNLVDGTQATLFFPSVIYHWKRTGKEIWVMLLVLFPPFDSAILKPDFDLL